MCLQQNSTRFGADLLGDSQKFGRFVVPAPSPLRVRFAYPHATPSPSIVVSGHFGPPFTSLQINMEILAVLILAVLILACATRNRSDHNPQIDPFFFSHDKDSMDDE